MKKITVDMGSYYTSSANETLVKAVARATDTEGNNPMIMFAYVGRGGIASELHYMREADFIATYIS